MSFCKNCGREVGINEQFCKSCGTPNENYVAPTVAATQATPVRENPVFGILAIVFGIVSPIVGFVFALIGLNKYHTPENLKKCKIGLGLSIGFAVLSVVMYVLFYVFFYAFFLELLNSATYAILFA